MIMSLSDYGFNSHADCFLHHIMEDVVTVYGFSPSYLYSTPQLISFLWFLHQCGPRKLLQEVICIHVTSIFKEIVQRHDKVDFVC